MREEDEDELDDEDLLDEEDISDYEEEDGDSEIPDTSGIQSVTPEELRAG